MNIYIHMVFTHRFIGVWTLSIIWYSREHDVSETVLKCKWGRRHLLSWAL
jgi:hypothetical protein